jgi:hypothetical protein
MVIGLFIDCCLLFMDCINFYSRFIERILASFDHVWSLRRTLLMPKSGAQRLLVIDRELFWMVFVPKNWMLWWDLISFSNGINNEVSGRLMGLNGMLNGILNGNIWEYCLENQTWLVGKSRWTRVTSRFSLLGNSSQMMAFPAIYDQKWPVSRY